MSLPLLLHTLRATLPVMFGYVPLGFAFGIMFTDMGYTWGHAVAMAAFVFAGSAQFLATGMVAMGESIPEVGLMTLILNSRQAFYGITLLKQLETVWWKKLYIIFTLSDEPFSLITTLKVPEEYDKHTYYAVMNAWTHFYWVFGCGLGAILSQTLPFDTTGMEFTLTALFVVLTMDQFFKVKTFTPFLVALGIGFLCLSLFEHTHMLVSAIFIAVTYILMTGWRTKWT